MDSKELIRECKAWIKDYNETHSGNCCIDSDTFEGDAYYLLNACIKALKVKAASNA